MTKPSNKDAQGLKVQGRQPRFFGIAVGLGGDIMKILMEAVFPRKCRSCGRFWHLGSSGTAGARQVPRTDPPEDALVDHFQRVAAPFLCPDCLTDFEAVTSPLCSCCGAMFASRIGADHLCGHCLRRGFQFRRARSAGVYGGALLSLIHQLKYRACLALCQPLGTLLQQIFELHWQPDEIDLVLPVPLHRRRFRRRGFNQAHLLTMAWANMPEARSIMNRLAKPREVMIRSRPTQPQTGLGKMARRRNIRGAFRVVAPERVKAHRILLVDDVYTTGATADEAARELKRQGAASVDLITIARTMPHPYR